MESLFLGVAALACPVGMGVMMWLMMRGQRHDHGAQDGPVAQDDQAMAQVQQLRAEIEQLKADRAIGRTTDAP